MDLKEQTLVSENDSTHQKLLQLGFNITQDGNYNITTKHGFLIILKFDDKKIFTVALRRPNEAEPPCLPENYYWSTYLSNYALEKNETIIDVLKRLSRLRKFINLDSYLPITKSINDEGKEDNNKRKPDIGKADNIRKQCLEAIRYILNKEYLYGDPSSHEELRLWQIERELRITDFEMAPFMTDPTHKELISLGFKKSAHGDYNLYKKNLQISLSFKDRIIDCVCGGSQGFLRSNSERMASAADWSTYLSDYQLQDNETIVGVIKRLNAFKFIMSL